MMIKLSENKGILKIELIIIWLCALTTMAMGQTVSVKADRTTILIGQQIKLDLTVEGQANQKPANFPDLPDSINHLLVLNRTAPKLINRNGQFQYSRTYTITSFDSGTWRMPPLNVNFPSKGNISSQPDITVSVQTTDISSLKDYHGIKGIWNVKGFFDYLRLIGLIVILGVVVFALWKLWKYLKHRKKPKKIKIAKDENGLNKIINSIEEISRKERETHPQQKRIFTDLILLLRNFTDEFLQTDSSTKTTEEYMLQLSESKILSNKETETRYFQMLRLTDAIKFARYTAEEEECIKAFETSKHVVRTVYQSQFKKKN